MRMRPSGLLLAVVLIASVILVATVRDSETEMPDASAAVVTEAAPPPEGPRPVTSTAPAELGQRLEGRALRDSKGELVPVTSELVCPDGYAGQGSESGQRCKRRVRYEHPYDAYSYDQLVSIADHDAAASFILGDKLFWNNEWKQQYFDYEQAVGHLLNAAILSGNPQPYESMLVARDLAGMRMSNGAIDYLRAQESYVWIKAGLETGLIDATDLGYPLLLKRIEKEVGKAVIEEWTQRQAKSEGTLNRDEPRRWVIRSGSSESGRRATFSQEIAMGGVNARANI